jgi:hypothetical protein
VQVLGSARLAPGIARRSPGWGGAAIGAAAVAIGLLESPPLRLAAALVAIGAVVASAAAVARREVARRRCRAPALKPFQERRRLEVPVEPRGALSVVQQELGSAGFLVDRIESAQDARVVLASRAGVPFAGSMIAHGGLALALGALGLGSLAGSGPALAAGALAAGVGGVLRFAWDAEVVWCAAQAREGGTALELVVSGSLLPALVARCSRRLAERIGLRFACSPAAAAGGAVPHQPGRGWMT